MRRTRTALLFAAALAFCSGAVQADDLKLSNKWRIQCSGGAESAGEIRFRVTPRDGAASDVIVPIKDGRSENGVARDIREAFQAQLPKGRYDVETDDGEDVLIKKNLTEPQFEVAVVSSTVEDVRINLDRE